MGIEQAPTAKGKQAATGLRQAAAGGGRKTEAETGHRLKKGAAHSRNVRKVRTAKAPAPSRKAEIFSRFIRSGN